ncbi:MAG: transporter substrate-binding domain-containing protein [Dongiaceae bacterium]
MKIVQSLVAAATILVICATPADAGETLDRVLAAGRLVNAADEEYPPFSYRDGEGVLVGFDIEVATEVAKRFGVIVEHVTPGWDEISRGDWRGRWDVCFCSLTAEDARAARLAVPVAYYHLQSVALVRRDDARFNGRADFTGRRLGVQAGTIHERYLTGAAAAPAGLGAADILRYDTEPLAIAALLRGDGAAPDAVILGRLTASEQVGDGRPLRILEPPLSAEPVVVAIAPGDPAFAAALSRIVAEMRADGTLRALSERRFGIDITAASPD